MKKVAESLRRHRPLMLHLRPELVTLGVAGPGDRLPFGLAALLQLTSPDYLPLMFEDPLGQRILLGTGALMIIGIFWMRRLIRIEV